MVAEVPGEHLSTGIRYSSRGQVAFGRDLSRAARAHGMAARMIEMLPWLREVD